MPLLDANAYRRNAPAEGDPELLGAQDKIRYAEYLIREEHQVLAADFGFWGKIADYLNDVAHTPERTGNRPRDWTAFNRAQDMAGGYLRMSDANLELRAELLARYFRPESEPLR